MNFTETGFVLYRNQICIGMKIQTGRGTIPLIILIGIWSISALNALPGLAVSPILGQLSVIFPHATELDIQMLSSLPSLLVIPFILLSGKLTEKVNNILLLRTGLWIFLLSGVLYLLSGQMWQLIAVSALLGIGSGLIVPLSTGLISHYFVGKYRTKQFGYSSAITNVTLVLATTLTGYLAEVNWHLPFVVYLFPVISIVLSYFLQGGMSTVDASSTEPDTSEPAATTFVQTEMSEQTVISSVRSADSVKTLVSSIHVETSVHPSMGADSSVHPVSVQPVPGQRHFGKHGIAVNELLAVMGFYGFTTYLVLVVTFNLPFLMEEYGFDSGHAGILISLFFLAIMSPGLILDKIVLKQKRYTKFWCLIEIAIGLILILLSRSEIWMGLGAVFMGLGYGVIQPLIYDQTSRLAIPRKVTLALAFVMVMNYVAILVCPFIIDFFQQAMHVKSQQFGFWFNLALTCVALIGCWLMRRSSLFDDYVEP